MERRIPHPGHVYRVGFIRERSCAIGRRESIIYLGNYSEAGSTPVAREPQIIECELSLFSAVRGRAGQTGIVKFSLQSAIIFSRTKVKAATMRISLTTTSPCRRAGISFSRASPRLRQFSQILCAPVSPRIVNCRPMHEADKLRAMLDMSFCAA